MFKFILRLLPYEFLGALVEGLTYLLVVGLGVSPETVQNLIDSINQELIRDERYNRYVIRTPALLRVRIEKELDKAIQDYEDLTGDDGEVTIESPTFTEELEGETPLGGELRLTTPHKKDYEL